MSIFDKVILGGVKLGDLYYREAKSEHATYIEASSLNTNALIEAYKNYGIMTGVEKRAYKKALMERGIDPDSIEPYFNLYRTMRNGQIERYFFKPEFNKDIVNFKCDEKDERYNYKIELVIPQLTQNEIITIKVGVLYDARSFYIKTQQWWNDKVEVEHLGYTNNEIAVFEITGKAWDIFYYLAEELSEKSSYPSNEINTILFLNEDKLPIVWRN